MVETQRLILRELEDQDLEGLFELESNPRVFRFLERGQVQSKSDIPLLIDKIRNQYKKNGIGRWAMIEKRSDEFLGWTGLKLEEQETNGYRNYYDLGYRMIPRYWGKGYATEGALAAVKYGFEQMKLDIIYGAAHANNIASNRVMQKAGLQLVESFRYKKQPHHWYALKANSGESIL